MTSDGYWVRFSTPPLRSGRSVMVTVPCLAEKDVRPFEDDSGASEASGAPNNWNVHPDRGDVIVTVRTSVVAPKSSQRPTPFFRFPNAALR